MKLEALNGGRAKLSPEQLEFVGVAKAPPQSSDGWRQPYTLPALPSPDAAMLQALMAIEAVDLGRERMSFLGGG
jgi:hypothetical protein